VPPDDAQLTLAFYDSARAEIVQRLSLRETTLLAWVATVGVILGLVAKDQGLLTVIPLLCLPFAWVVHRHDLIIGYINDYRFEQLDPKLRQNDPLAPMHWDHWARREPKIRRFRLVEVVAIKLIQVPVSLWCLSHESLGLWMVLGWIFTLFVVWMGINDYWKTCKSWPRGLTPTRWSRAVYWLNRKILRRFPQPPAVPPPSI
jgi:hypothetical protein